MSTSVTFNQTSYSIPAAGELNWSSLSAFLIDVGTNAQTTNAQQTSARVATSSPVTVSSTDYAVITNLGVAGAVAVNLPAGVTGRQIAIVDGKGDAATNNITITPAAGNINGAATYVIDGNRNGVVLVYSGTEWTILSEFISSSSGTIPRSQIAAGTPDQVVINSGTGALSSEAQLAGTRGGTGVSSTATFPASGVVVTEAATQTLTNKTISGASNTISNISLTSQVTGILPTANGGTNQNSTATFPTSGVVVTEAGTQTLTNKTLTGNIATNLVSGAATITLPTVTGTLATLAGTETLSNKTLGSTNTLTGATAASFTNTGTITLPTATGTLATLAGTEALTNKDIDGGTASNTSRITIPKAALSTLTGLTRKQGTLVYDTTANALLADDGTNLNQIGGGSGLKNYVLAPSTSSGWVASSTDITVATDTTAADLPRAQTTKTGIIATGVNGNSAYIYYRFTLDEADYNKKMMWQFDQRPVSGYVASDFKIDIYSNTASNYGGTSTRLALSTDSSSITAIPNLTGTFGTTWGSGNATAPYMEIRIGLNGTNTHALVVSDVIVGPGIITQGPAVSSPITYTPTVAGLGTVTFDYAHYIRIGEHMKVMARFTGGTVTGTTATISLPTGLTVNQAGGVTNGNSGLVGRWIRANASATTRKSGTMMFNEASTSVINFGSDDYTAAASPFTQLGGSTLFSNSDVISLEFQVPIAEWAGSGTVNIAQNDVEYASNSSATDAADTTSFAYGPSGSVGVIGTTALTAGRSKRVRFLTPIQPTDTILVEVLDSHTGSNNWQQLNTTNAFSLGATVQNGTEYGITIIGINSNSTDVDIYFARYATPSGATFGAAGQAWNSVTGVTRWRVKKFAGGQAVGFGLASATASGLVSGEEYGTFSASFTGPRSTSSTIEYARVGKMVTLYFPRNVGAAATSATFFTAASGTIPASLRPATFGTTDQSFHPIFVQDNAANQNSPGYIAIYTNGTIDINKSLATAGFTNSANCGWYETSITYQIS